MEWAARPLISPRSLQEERFIPPGGPAAIRLTLLRGVLGAAALALFYLSIQVRSTAFDE